MGVKRWVESLVLLESFRKDARTLEKPVKCHIPTPLFIDIFLGLTFACWVVERSVSISLNF